MNGVVSESAKVVPMGKRRLRAEAGETGRTIGGTEDAADGEIRSELLEDVGGEVSRLVDQKAAALRGWLGDLRFVPRFRTPLEQELSA